ncbi:MAG: hypothetical protein R3247_00255 [Rhodothermales bacterium]|nr:hypothetical protein [Rhodothermales bacterium]
MHACPPAPAAPSALRCLALLLLLALAASAPAAQPGPVRGVVWRVPADLAQATEDLRAMQQAGVEAVRTGLIRDDTLLTLADSLGLAIYQELPLDFVSAAALVDTLAFAERLLGEALQRASGHPSARHFGLARRSDTSAPRACAFFEALAQRAREAPGARVYYLTAFIESDRCAETVDFVLLDALDVDAPAARVARWRAAHAVPAGLGALGTWVGPEARPGLEDPHSPESQARYLETHLRHLLADTTAAGRAVFVHRWRDVPVASPSPVHDLARPTAHGYGLHAAGGAARPALAVVRGFFTDGQTTFAFPQGAAPPAPVPWARLLGWLVFLMLGATYALSPRFRYTVPRYFQAHGFYRDGIREGREVLLGSSIVMLLAVALSVGILGTVVLDVLRPTAAFRLVFSALPASVQQTAVALLAQPWMLILLLGSFYALGIALWASLLALVSRRRHPLLPGQALMLVLWARWPLLVLLLGAMTVPSLPAPWAVRGALLLVAVGGLVALYALIRTLYDYAAITYVPGPFVLLLALANPMVLLALALTLPIFALDLDALATFAWHLARRE